MTGKEKYAETSFELERSSRLHPYGQYLYDYAEVVREGRFHDAEPQPRMAARADDEMMKARELPGGLKKMKTNKTGEAAREYGEALTPGPDLVEIGLRLGIARAADRTRAEAAEHARKAAQGIDVTFARQTAMREAGLR